MNPSAYRSLLRSVRAASALGLASISMTGEIGAGYLAFSWLAWLASFVLDRFPEWQHRLRRYETPAVAGLAGVFVLDFFGRGDTIFIAITHLLLLFQILKWLGEKKRRDCLQILFFSFFQILAACTLSLEIWHALILLALIPAAITTLFWHQVVAHEETAPQAPAAAHLRSYRRLIGIMCLGAIPMNIILTTGVFIFFPRLTWNVSLPGLGAGRVGFADQVNLARSGSLRPDNTTVLWLDIPNARDRAHWSGYLRGAAMDYFDGRQWLNPNPSGRIISPDRNGVFNIHPAFSPAQPFRCTVTLINSSASTLFHIGRAVRVMAPFSALQEDAAGCLRWMGGWNRPLRYEVQSDVGSGSGWGSVDS
ncbi:MAG TPA: DUF3488 domain-containing protein, partial [Elusimicrobiota bacterium]|nr:DUF3488 domain-containing protein [Elusimicrobiota bacterium]